MTEIEQEPVETEKRIKELEDEITALTKDLSHSKDEVKNLQVAKTDLEVEAVNLKEELDEMKKEREELKLKALRAEEKLAEENSDKKNNKRDVSETDKDLVESILLRANATELEMGKIMELMSNAEALSPEDKQKMEDLQSKIEHLEQQLELEKENAVICETQTKEAQTSFDRIRSMVIAADDLNVLKRTIFKKAELVTNDKSSNESKKQEEPKRSEHTTNTSFLHLGERIDALAKGLNLSEEKERITSLIELFKKLQGKPTVALTSQSADNIKTDKLPIKSVDNSQVDKLSTMPEKTLGKEKDILPVQERSEETLGKEKGLPPVEERPEETSELPGGGDTIDHSEDTSPNKRVRFSQINEDFKDLEENLNSTYKLSSDAGSDQMNIEAEAMFGDIPDL